MSWPFNAEITLAIVSGLGIALLIILGLLERESQIKRKQAEFKESQEYRDYLEQREQGRAWVADEIRRMERKNADQA